MIPEGYKYADSFFYEVIRTGNADEVILKGPLVGVYPVVNPLPPTDVLSKLTKSPVVNKTFSHVQVLNGVPVVAFLKGEVVELPEKL